MAKKIYKEKQQYENYLILGILGLTSALLVLGGIRLLFDPQGDYLRPISLFIIALSMGGLIWWLTNLQLKVTISKKNIKFKLSPIHPKKQAIAWEDIERCTLVKTSEAAQWSGGNITFNHEKRVTLSGRNGLSIKTKNGEFYFIGFKNLSQLQQVLDDIAFQPSAPLIEA